MSNISKELREKLSQNYTIARPKIVSNQISKDGTQKWLLEFADGEKVEMVYIPEEDRGTLCISSQIGCAMGCKFCNTGKNGFVRNMSVEELVQQVLVARDELREWDNLNKGIGEGRAISNIVIMGMGEPLINYDNIVKALKIINNPDGIAFSTRRITLSTCGLAPKIRELANDEVKVNLAISLHASDDETRKKIMPIAEQYKIKDIMEACNYYARGTSDRRITFEYIMIKDLNDSEDDACKLIALIKRYRTPAKFNLIPFNKWEGCDFEPSPMDRVNKFAKILTDAGFPSPIRKPRGQDISAACGLLKSNYDVS
jgi:23S rRNA (adenine2503-C2)-methyltransferase